MDRSCLAVIVYMRDSTHASHLQPGTCTGSCALCTQLCYSHHLTLFLDGDVQYEIEAVLAVRESRHNKKQFLVKWLGYGPEHNTWEPEANLTNCSEKLQTFRDAARSLKAPAPAKDQRSG